MRAYRNDAMKILVVTSEPVSAADLRRALAGDAGAGDVEVMVVAPALQTSALRFWLADVDEAIERARATERETVERLSQEGVQVDDSETGESDPEQAIEDALHAFPADEIVVFTHPEGEQHYREDVNRESLEQRFKLPVRMAIVGGD
jgi:nucleotide-binding universal stress UspA family protein